jgi:hypothetical protein
MRVQLFCCLLQLTYAKVRESASDLSITDVAANDNECSALSTKPRIHFAVVMGVFERPGDHQFLLPQLTSFQSLATQTFKNWTLVLTGDGLAASGIAHVFQALDNAHIPRHKVLFRNMEADQREVNLYKRIPLTHNILWGFAGANALNLGLDIAVTLQHATHVARLDDDDRWLPHHLSVLAATYQSWPEAGFVHTQASGTAYSTSGYPQHPVGPPIEQPPLPCEVMHATTSWSLAKAVSTLRYRQQAEQLSTVRTMTACCNADTCPQVMNVDTDMWERVWSLVHSGALVALFIPQATVMYTNKDLKTAIVQQFQPIRPVRSVRHTGQKAVAKCTMFKPLPNLIP